MDSKHQLKGITNADAMRSHWDSVYVRKPSQEVSWFQPRPQTSLELMDAAGLASTDGVIDVGGGASMLVDCLLESGFSDLTVLDISRAAIDTSRGRLGRRAAEVSWMVADVLTFRPCRTWYLWHDRACFHFMTSKVQRQEYVQGLEQAVVAGGACIIAAFAPDGPLRCSGLNIMQYDAKAILEVLGKNWRLEKQVHETHHTPLGATQSFNFFLLRRI